MSYFTPLGLSVLSGVESSNNPLAQNPTSSASGLYGFLTSTWDIYAPQAGVDLSEYPTAASAPSDVQTQVASITPTSNWTCPGCDPTITSLIQTNPNYVSGAPVSETASDNGLSFTIPDYASAVPQDAYGLSENTFTNPVTGQAVPVCGSPGADPVVCEYVPGVSPNEPGVTDPTESLIPGSSGSGASTLSLPTSVTNAISGIGNALGLATSGSTWQEFGLIALGTVLLIGALFMAGFERLGKR